MIRLEHVSKSYRTSTRPALDDVTVAVGKGEFAFLIGPSGSGKSTLLRLLLREEVASAGDVYVADLNVGRLSQRRIPQLRQRVGCVFQDFRLLANKTVSENVAFALEVIGKPRHTIRKVVPEVLELVGLEGKADRMPHELSGGEQQRVALARALITQPKLLLADEPTGDLDVQTAESVFALIARLHREHQLTSLIATHNLSFARRCHRVLRLQRGLVEEIQPESLPA